MTETMTETTKADSDDDYLNDAVVRAATKRLQREFQDEQEVVDVRAERWDRHDSRSDYIEVELQEHTLGNGHHAAYLIQMGVGTGAVKIAHIDTEFDTLRFCPTETRRT